MHPVLGLRTREEVKEAHSQCSLIPVSGAWGQRWTDVPGNPKPTPHVHLYQQRHLPSQDTKSCSGSASGRALRALS